MEKDSTLNLMEHYDFSKPINVKILFKENDDEPLFKNVFKEQILNYCVRKQDEAERSKSNSKVTCKIKTANKTLKKDKFIVREKRLHFNDISHCSKENQLTENLTPVYIDTYAGIAIEVDQSYLMQNNCSVEAAVNIRNTMPEKHQRSYDIDENKLLDIVSENLILLMRLYYYYRQKCNKDTALVNDLTQQLEKLKAHFFELSYSTVVSLILPQEDNEFFIENFLNKTVTYANKQLQCQCEKKDVDPFYNEMIVWVKKKREHIKSFELRFAMKNNNNESKNSDNKILKESLAESPTFCVPNTTNINKRADVSTSPTASASVPKTCDQVMTSENRTCIFSTEDLEKQINININHNQSRNQNIQQTLKETRQYCNTDCLQTDSSVNSTQFIYNHRVNQMKQSDCHQRNTKYHNSVPQPPPPYYPKHYHTITSPNCRHIAIGKQNYHQSQLNSNAYASAVCSAPNIRQMYYGQLQEYSTTPTPIMANGTSLNPNNLMMYPRIGRCCICGKITYTRCSKCNNYSYCSSLCQELDAGTHSRFCKT